MKITPSTTLAEIMIMLQHATNHMEKWIHDPIPTFTVFSDGGFTIDESYYEVSATCQSNIKEENDNNSFTGKSISDIMQNRLES